MAPRRVLYIQTFQAEGRERQAELDLCLKRNMESKIADAFVIYQEAGSTTRHTITDVPTEIIQTTKRLTYAAWLEHVRGQVNCIGLLANADIELISGFGAELETALQTEDSAIALTRYNRSHAERRALNRFPQWTQDLWAIRSDADITESLLAASSLPIGKPGCDNRFAHVLWSHGFKVKNPCHWLITEHHHADDTRKYEQQKDRLYGAACYVYPSLSLNGESELQHVIWSKNEKPIPGALVNQVRERLTPWQLQTNEMSTRLAFAQQLKDAELAAEYDIYKEDDISEKVTRISTHMLTTHGRDYRSDYGFCIDGVQVRWGSQTCGEQRLIIRSRPDEHERFVRLTEQTREFISFSAAKPPIRRLHIHLEGNSNKDTSDNAKESEIFEITVYERKGAGETNTASTMRSNWEHESIADGLPLGEPRYVIRSDINFSQWCIIHRFNQRFSIWQCGDRLLCVDQFWPTAVVYHNQKGYPEQIKGQAKDMFLWGFARPVLEWKGDHISPSKRYAEDNRFWQYPCRTEQDAFNTHLQIKKPFIEEGEVHIYLGMPWATWIDRKHVPRRYLQCIRSRLQAMSSLVNDWGLTLRVHTVCQHIKWHEWLHLFHDSAITDLWLSHKKRGMVSAAGMRLESWPLYAVNILEPDRRVGLKSIAIDERPILASFRGAYMPHYISDVRKRLRGLSTCERFKIEVNDEWHFNPVVYGHQVLGQPIQNTDASNKMIIDYNRMMASSVFSLCPSGAGPNTLRLWESLGAGTIPVVLSDDYEPPEILGHDGHPLQWDHAVIFHREDEWETLPKRLASITRVEILERQHACIKLFAHSRMKTCFARSSSPAQRDSLV